MARKRKPDTLQFIYKMLIAVFVTAVMSFNFIFLAGVYLEKGSVCQDQKRGGIILKKLNPSSRNLSGDRR